jgi:hypothetical protein
MLCASEYEDVKKALDSILKTEGITLTTREYNAMVEEIIQERNAVPPNDTPDRSWVNHTIEVTFDKVGGRNINGKTKKIKILEFKTDSDGYEYFSVEDLTDQDINQLYIFWFDNLDGKQEAAPNIVTYKILR